jgi:hypothetical protein
MVMTVEWEELSSGLRRVTLEAGEFSTSRPTYLFIPVGPRSIPALGSFKLFSKALQEELA